MLQIAAGLVSGIWLGLLVWWRTFYSLYKARRALKEGLGFSQYALPVLLSAGPWLLIGVLAAAVIVLPQPHAIFWTWFFGAFIASPILLVVFVRRILRRQKENAAKRAQQP